MFEWTIPLKSKLAIITWTWTIRQDKGFLLYFHKSLELLHKPLTVRSASVIVNALKTIPLIFHGGADNIFAHNLSLTLIHETKSRQCFSVQLAARLQAAGGMSGPCNQISSGPFVGDASDIREMFRCRYDPEHWAGAPLGCTETQRSTRVPAQTPRPVPDCSRSAACFSRDQPCGRPERKGRTDICRTLWSEQSQRKWIYKRSLWGISIASATEARCQATSRHAHLLFHVCVGLDACLALMFSISTDWSMISKLLHFTEILQED